MAWGTWDQPGMLSEKDKIRLSRTGMPPLSVEQGLDLFDVALGAGSAAVLPLRLDLAVLGGAPSVPALLRGLVRSRNRRDTAAPEAADGLIEKLTAMGEAERTGVLLDIVRRQVAVVLDHAGPETIEPDLAFKELGFDSLTAVELRNRLGAATGLQLSATVVFDYPTATQLTEHLLDELALGAPDVAGALLADLDRLEQVLAGASVDEQLFRKVAGRLDVLRSRWAETKSAGERDEVNLDSASDEDMFAMLDEELGN
ncbi:ketoreductase and phosphopantetheine attachment site domain-containing protein [Actinoplanes bogorensis]|uniref:Ketoreductase and phosphopantetheine attachment site domain-containing protein n=2 Tax=Paractinoplanes bogorensis TaxID=1610840 RepID=A0ABS5YK53_9ACTN|nr:ketoreductase and phosphopantetheine attachment site domain-containing protein [Actinoplanes bogorensis]